MGLRLLVPPSVEPVTVAEQKAFMRVEIADEDALTASLITAARQAAESITGRALITQQWLATFEVPRRTSRRLELPVAPVRSVESVIVDGMALDKSAYVADIVSEPAAITLPKMAWKTAEATFTCGYGSTGADVPEPLRLAIKLMAAHWAENRLAVADASHTKFEELPMGVRYLLATYRLWGRAL